MWDATGMETCNIEKITSSSSRKLYKLKTRMKKKKGKMKVLGLGSTVTAGSKVRSSY